MPGARPIVERVERLQRLAVFEAAARLGSFTAAAAELGTSQPAVTRQIRELERSTGIGFFARTANRSELTPEGHRFHGAVDAAFAGIERCLDDLFDPMFVLAAPPGFAQQLIVPVLDELHEALPDVDIRLWLYDRDSDLDAGSYDAAIRVGTGDWAGVEDAALFAERVVPVATHDVAEEHGLDANSAAFDVLAAPLLHMEAAGHPWMSWSEWLAAFDLVLTNRRRVVHSTYPAVVQRMLAGRGVALGWRGVIDQLLDDGLVTVVGPEISTNRSYRVTWPTPAAHDPDSAETTLRTVVNWLQSSFGEQ